MMQADMSSTELNLKEKFKLYTAEIRMQFPWKQDSLYVGVGWKTLRSIDVFFANFSKRRVKC